MRAPQSRRLWWSLTLGLVLHLMLDAAATAQSSGRTNTSQEVVISIAGAPMIDASGSPFVLLDFSDYQCPVCRRFVHEVLPALLDEYVLSGTLRYVYLDFPLQRIHPQATEAAYAAHCAGEQGRYWEMHDRLFLDQHFQRWRKWHEFASWAGLDLPSFSDCMQSGRYVGLVESGLAAGNAAGIRGTPTFFLGVLQPDGRNVRASSVIDGMRPYARFRDWIDGWLKQQRR